MPDRIDYGFVSRLEGGSKTSGYVPAAAVSKSGVTIATGFDLGQRSERDLRQLGIPESLIKSLKPYLGVKGKEAATLIKKKPLSISISEAQKIDKLVKKEHVGRLKIKYAGSQHNTKSKSLFDLPKEAQTVVASVSFQYGVNLDVATPKFWKAACSQDWAKVAEVLRNFGDAYPTRRKKEAALLESMDNDSADEGGSRAAEGNAAERVSQ